MKIIAVIPARYQASRLPGKLMKPLGESTIIGHTYKNTIATNLFSEVIVATDHDLIEQEIKRHGGIVFRSQKEHDCGSDRIAEAVSNSDADIIVNIQGDEPFLNKHSLELLLSVFKKDSKKEVDLASLMEVISKHEEVENPNNVKVIVDKKEFALYFSRSPIPYYRNTECPQIFYKHIGVYAFRREALLDFSVSKKTPLEEAEKIECIRYLEKGKKIKMVLVDQPTIGIDTLEDLTKAQQFLKSQ